MFIGVIWNIRWCNLEQEVRKFIGLLKNSLYLFVSLL